MASKSRKAGTTKQPAAARRKARDRKLLERAEAETAEGAPRAVIGANQVVLARSEFDSIVGQLHRLETEVIGAWACRDDEANGLERILVPLYAARRNFECAVSIEMESAEVRS